MLMIAFATLVVLIIKSK
ncbi:MAG: hypothetical protein LBR56_09750 [Sporomusaceae bacterium]|nr:hypothetical protein [Sporomusaceae bacterium]